MKLKDLGNLEVKEKKVKAKTTGKTEQEKVKIREYEGLNRKIVRVIAIAMGLTCFGYGLYPYIASYIIEPIYLIFLASLVFLLYPASAKSPQKRPSILDLICIVVSIVGSLYFLFEFEELAFRVGFWSDLDMVVSAMMILIILEMARRKVGLPVMIVGLIGLLYCLLGPYMPGLLRHAGISLRRTLCYSYASLDGIYGVPLGVMCKYVFLIITFGAFLNKSGAGNFMIKLALGLVGHLRGGPALSAVFASSMFAMISGSSTANVATTGVFTIPLMKKVGYKPHNAAAVEVGASTGGGLCPPIMAAAAFIMAGLTGIPYATIALAAILPIIIYYTAVFFFINYISAKNKNITILSSKELPDVKQIVKKGWYLMIPIGVIFYTIFSGYSPTRAATLGIISTVASSYLRKETRMSIKDILDAFETGARTALTMSSAAACIGILMAAVGLTGLGLKFSHIIISLAGGNLFLLIILVGGCAFLVGMGLPIGAAYISVSILAAPALQLAGLSALAAHFVVLWFAQSSTVTPPVCMTSYVAAGIADADPFKTARAGLNITKGLFVMPFLIAYTSLVTGTWGERIITFIFCCLGMVALTSCVERYMIKKLSFLETIGLGLSCISLFIPSLLSRVIGLIIFAGLFFYHRKRVLLKGSAQGEVIKEK